MHVLTLLKLQSSCLAPELLQAWHPVPSPGSPEHLILRRRHLAHYRTETSVMKRVLVPDSLHSPQLQCDVLPGRQRLMARRVLVCQCAFGHGRHILDGAHVEVRRGPHMEQGDRSMLRSPCCDEVCGGKRRNRFRHDTAASSSY